MTFLSAAALLLTAQVSTAPWAPGGPSRGEDLVVSVVTFGPGSDIPSWWGHIAMVVEDTRLNRERLYNYGMFDFSGGFLQKFVQGRLEFWVGEDPVKATYRMYGELDRSVHVMQLNLSPERAQQLAQALAVNVLPQNREYLYQHYDDNCATRPRDMVDRAFDGALTIADVAPARMTLREHTRRYSSVFPPLALGLDFLQNDMLDRPITRREEAFLPDELERQLDALVVDGQPAVRHKLIVHEPSAKRAPTPQTAPSWNLWLLLGSAAFGGAVIALRRSRARAARIALGAFLSFEGFLWGALGVGLFLFAFCTNHEVTHRNENMLLISPVSLALLPLGIMLMRNSKRADAGLKWVTLIAALTASLSVILKVLPCFDQANGNVICLVLPLTLATAFAFWRPADAQ